MGGSSVIVRIQTFSNGDFLHLTPYLFLLSNPCKYLSSFLTAMVSIQMSEGCAVTVTEGSQPMQRVKAHRTPTYVSLLSKSIISLTIDIIILNHDQHHHHHHHHGHIKVQGKRKIPTSQFMWFSNKSTLVSFVGWTQNCDSRKPWLGLSMSYFLLFVLSTQCNAQYCAICCFSGWCSF